MPDVAITAPVAADSIDRLTLGASDARGGRQVSEAATGVVLNSYIQSGLVNCMAEE